MFLKSSRPPDFEVFTRTPRETDTLAPRSRERGVISGMLPLKRHIVIYGRPQ